MNHLKVERIFLFRVVLEIKFSSVIVCGCVVCVCGVVWCGVVLCVVWCGVVVVVLTAC